VDAESLYIVNRVVESDDLQFTAIAGTSVYFPDRE
jgi:hypothetical protein